MQLRTATTIHSFSFSSFTRCIHLGAREPRRLRAFDAGRAAVDSKFFEEIVDRAVGPVSASWYLRKILRARFFAKTAPHRAGFRSSRVIARWGVVQLVGHLTVNEDGEGSNPSAPAKFADSAKVIFLFSNKMMLSNNEANSLALQSDFVRHRVAEIQ